MKIIILSISLFFVLPLFLELDLISSNSLDRVCMGDLAFPYLVVQKQVELGFFVANNEIYSHGGPLASTMAEGVFFYLGIFLFKVGSVSPWIHVYWLLSLHFFVFLVIHLECDYIFWWLIGGLFPQVGGVDGGFL